MISANKPALPQLDVLLSGTECTQRIEAMLQRYSALLEQAFSGTPHAQGRIEMLEEFQLALQELQASVEEIHVQHEEVHEAQQLIEHERRRYSDLFNNAPVAYVVTDLGGTIREANQAAVTLLRTRMTYIVGLPLASFVREEDRPQFRQQLERLKTDRHPAEWEIHLRLPKSKPFPVAVAAAHSESTHGEAPSLRWLIRDISVRKQLEEETKAHVAELAHMARLSVLGEMAAGLAHELNQPLTAIANYARGCVRRLTEGQGNAANILPILAEVTAQAERGGAIVQRLHDFVQKRPLQQAAVDVANLVHEVVALADREIRASRARIHFDLRPHLPPVHVDRVQIEQVLLNLMLNALEAMAEQVPDSRRLTIQAQLIEGGRVLISVSDNGPGLAAESCQRLFEPFFTTKPGGLGLGLAICRTILQAHGGHIWAAPAQPRGMAFHFTLPVERGTSA